MTEQPKEMQQPRRSRRKRRVLIALVVAVAYFFAEGPVARYTSAAMLLYQPLRTVASYIGPLQKARERNCNAWNVVLIGTNGYFVLDGELRGLEFPTP